MKELLVTTENNIDKVTFDRLAEANLAFVINKDKITARCIKNRYKWPDMLGNFPVDCIVDYYNYCEQRNKKFLELTLRGREKTSLGIEAYPK